ncbi:MAG: hypothetical protein QW112_02940 [Candidatus Micrarchaeia archaeon]
MPQVFRPKETEFEQRVRSAINNGDLAGAICEYKRWKGPKASIFDDKSLFPQIVKAAEKHEKNLRS